MKYRIPLLVTLLILFLALPFGGFAAAQPKPGEIGKVIVGTGQISARDAAGEERRLRRRGAVFQGDTIVVGDNGFVQVRFTDGGVVALRPGTEFKVDEYRFEGAQEGTERAVFSLLKGGLRTITGAIGKDNKDNYKVETPVATIGIRGTHYGLRYCSEINEATQCGPDIERGLYGGVADGAVVVRNLGGEGVFGNDRFFFVASIDTPPVNLLEPPGVVFDALEISVTDADLGDYREGDQARVVDDEVFARELGDYSAGLSEDGLFDDRARMPLDHLPVYEFDLDVGGGGTVPWEGNVFAVAAKIHDATGEPAWLAGNLIDGEADKITLVYRDGVITEAHVVDDPGCLPECSLTSGKAVLAESGRLEESGKPRVEWGRWDGAWTFSDGQGAGEPYGSWHYAASSDVTPVDDLKQLNANKVFAYFNPLAGTTPTDEYGNTGSYAASTPYMVVDFGHYQVVQYVVDVRFDQTEIQLHGQLDGPVTFTSSSVWDMPLVVNCSGCESSQGEGSANVTFVGSMASHAVGSFEMHTPGGNTALGAVLLEQGAAIQGGTN